MRFRNRRGAFVVIAAILFLGMVGVSAIAIDFSRLWTLRNELQTSADASAMGGALQLIGARNRAQADSAARVFAANNRAMGRAVVVDSVQLGRWNDSTRVFSLGATPNDAVRVVVADTMSGLLMSAFGIAKPRLKARAVGWAGAPVATSGCVKPWAIPYEFLMYAINLQRGISPANSNANLTRAFDQILDVQALNVMTPAQRTFNLTWGGSSAGTIGSPIGGYGPASIPGPGNYQAVDLPIYWKAPSGPYYPYGSYPPGTSNYVANVAGCNTMGVGDSLSTKPGAPSQPTLNALSPAVCYTISNSTADCLDASGNIGVTLVGAFFSCKVNCQGNSFVRVDLMGSFTLTKVYPNNSFPGHSKGEIQGIFNPIQANGPVGVGPTTLTKVILVQ